MKIFQLLTEEMNKNHSNGYVQMSWVTVNELPMKGDKSNIICMWDCKRSTQCIERRTLDFTHEKALNPFPIKGFPRY